VRSLLALTLALLVLLTAACGEDDNAGSGGFRVVATTTQVADLVRNVGGDRVAVTGLLPANADPHDHEVRPSDVAAVSEAGLVVRSGGDLDAWLTDAVEGSGSDAPQLDLIDHVRTLEGGHEGHAHDEEDHEGDEHAEQVGIDPHWWQDPRNAVPAVAAIRDALVAADPANAATYRANAAAYVRELRALDRAVARCIDGVPADRRKLVTTHDSLGYYASRYGIEVVGAVIPSLSTQGQASAGATAELVRTIRAEGVTAIFAESGLEPKIEQAIAREAGARVGEPLWADTLGPEGSGADTYVGSIAANTRALVDGFGGGERPCTLPS
jgi:ABC-type Zn uptake system ZnuABC Zn-binding protein ZnuA